MNACEKRVISLLILIIISMGMLNSAYALDEKIGTNIRSGECEIDTIRIIEEKPSEFMANRSKYILAYLTHNFAEEIGIDKDQKYSFFMNIPEILQINTSDNNIEYSIEYSDIFVTYNNDPNQASIIGRIYFMLDENGHIINIQFNTRTSSGTLTGIYFVITKNGINNVIQNETTLDTDLLNQYLLNVTAPGCQSAYMSSVSRHYKYGEGNMPYAISKALLPVIYNRDNKYNHSSWYKNCEAFKDAFRFDNTGYRYKYGMNSYKVRDALEITGCGKTYTYAENQYEYTDGLIASIRSGRPSILKLKNKNYEHTVIAFGTIGNNYIVGYDPDYKSAGDQLFILYAPNNINLANVVMIQPDDLILYSMESVITLKIPGINRLA